MNDKFLHYTNENKIDSVNSFENNIKGSKLITDIKNKKLYIIIDGQEIYIKHLSLPRLNKYETEKLIFNELNYYINDMSNVVFSYNIYSIHENVQEILVFCLNWSKLDLLKQFADKNNDIAAVYMIQLCFLKYYKSYIKSEKFLFIFKHNDNAYLLMCSSGNMISNKVIQLKDGDCDSENIVKAVNDLYNDYTIPDKIDIYLANMDAPNEMTNYNDRYNIIKLNEVPSEKIVNCCIH
jgi:hypothetical protein